MRSLRVRPARDGFAVESAVEDFLAESRLRDGVARRRTVSE